MTEKDFTKFIGHVSRSLLSGKDIPPHDIAEYRENLLRHPFDAVFDAFNAWMRGDPKAGDWRMYSKIPNFSVWRGYLEAELKRKPKKGAVRDDGPYVHRETCLNNLAIMAVINAAIRMRFTYGDKPLPQPPHELVEKGARIYIDRLNRGTEWSPRDFAALFYSTWPDLGDAILEELQRIAPVG